MIRITQTGVVAEPDAVSRLRAEFEETGLAMLPGFLSPQLLAPFLTQIESAAFVSTNEHWDGAVYGTTLKMPRTEPAVRTLHFMLNLADLFTIIGQASGHPGLRNYMGRMHRTNAGANEYIGWHDDAIEHRVVGLGINLTTRPYSGGLFQIRDPGGHIRGEIGQLPPGDGFIFRIGDGWEHRLTAVESGQRTVAFGWFRTQPDWHAMLIASLNSTAMMKMENAK